MKSPDTTTESPFSPLVERAIELSAQWHDRTFRKSRWRDAAFRVPEESYLKVPVVAHVATVALTVQRAGWDEVTVAAAFLHDVIEDENRWGHRMSYEELSRLIRTEVADLVRQVSEEKHDAKGNPRSWRERKEGYLSHLGEATDRAVAISLADKLHNLWTMNESIRSGTDVFSPGDNRRALQGDPEEQLWFFNAVCSIARERTDPRLSTLLAPLEVEIARFETLTRTT